MENSRDFLNGAGTSKVGAGLANYNQESQDKKMLDDKEKVRALQATLGALEKQYGKGTVLRLGSKDSVLPISSISTGSISVDAALGVGGVPRGRIVEIFGPESSGKTTIALQVVAQAQKAGGIAAYVDVEHALDPVYAQKLGVDIDNMLVSQPDYAEQALEITNTLIASGSIDVLVVDSVAALVPKAELDGEMGDAFVGIQARLMSQAMRKLTGVVAKSNTCLIFINQIREKIGVMFGSPETTPGGKALKFYASVRLDIRRTDNVKVGTDVVGMRAKVTVRKNKVAPPFRVCEFDILWSEGISRTGSILDLGVEMALVKKAGAYFSYGETNGSPPISSSSSQWMTSARMKPRWRSEWMTPAHSGARAPDRKVQARLSLSPVVKKVRRPSMR